MEKKKPGERVRVTTLRDGKSKEFEIRLAEPQ
jgi:hypothetical protein